ncbi:hypothetical protein BGZ63DRAFT_359196 [Mariannaea sp. PMI_226]|nr:hypothetical protein BGZ63DRAFT_359196 [Mariannaea sp. PMI_226]
MYVTDIYVSKQNYGLVGVGFTFTVLAVLFVLLRIITRLWLVKGMGFDDGFIIISAFGTLAFLVAVMQQVRYGLGDPPNPQLLSPFIQATVASVISYTICHITVKLSISIQCLRIFATPAARRIFIGFIIFFSVYGTLCLCLTIMTCWPVAKYWDDSIPGKCLDNRAMRYAFAGINIVNDILLLIAPMPFLQGLNIQRRVKFVLMGVFAAGGVSVPIPDRPVKGIDIAIWSGLECNIAIICACIPSLKPLSSRAFPGLVGSFANSSKHPSNGRYPHDSGHNYDNITHNSHGHNDSTHDTGKRGINVQQSFEMKTTTGSEDNDSEKNLVTGHTAAYQSQIYSSTHVGSPADGRWANHSRG